MRKNIPGLKKIEIESSTNIKKSSIGINYKGLNNYGNMCYSNVIMQSLVSIEEFVEMLNQIYNKIESETEFFLYNDTMNLDLSFKYPVICNLVKIMNFYKSIIIF